MTVQERRTLFGRATTVARRLGLHAWWRMYEAGSAGRTAWRRSLRLRVVTTTVVLSLAVVGAVGGYLVHRIANGLVDAKVTAAVAEASTGTQQAQRSFDNIDTGDPQAVKETAYQVITRLATAGGPGGTNYVVLVRSPSSDFPVVGEEFTSCPEASPWCTPPANLRTAVQRDGGQAYRFAEVPGSNGGSVPGVVVGSRTTIPGAGLYELYYLFPMADEQRTLQLVQGTLAAGGLAMVLLVGLVAFVVTRQVVTPVQMAAGIAERLAAGRLEERMHVRGEDDLARLGASFNKMATNLQRQIRQLEDLSRVQRRFVSDVSHELRTPLTTVRMAADVIYDARDEFDAATGRSAELLQAQLDRFESLLTDLLEISRFDAGAAALEAEPVDLRDLAQRVIEATETLAQHKGSDLRLMVPSEPCVAEVDSRRIDRILRNLVVNAIEHGEGRPIDVRVASDDHAVAVAVRDHGVGLHPGETAMVFNRFWRADPARARTTGGTGLGLSIALEDARLHRGALQAWGRPGDGAQFRLTVPRSAGGELHGSPLPLEPLGGLARRAPSAAGGPYRRIAGQQGRIS